MAQARPLPPIPTSGELHGRLDGVALRNARSNLLEAIRESRQLDYTDLLKLDIAQKYKLVDYRPALSGDKKSAEDVKRSCLFLRNKLKHLLHPVKDRPPDWHKVQVSFCQCLPGVEQLLARIGFEREGQHYIIIQDRLSNESLADALVDLYLLAEELSLIIKNNHPLGAKLFANNELQPAAKRIAPSSGMHEMVSAMQRKLNQVCDLCGEVTATVTCQESHCSKRRLCENCDGRWHGHPDRRGHVRRKISEAVGANAVRLLPAAAGPVLLNSGVRKVVSNSQVVSYKAQLGLMGNDAQAKPQHPLGAAEVVPPKQPMQRPVPDLKSPVVSPRLQQQSPRQQQPPRQQPPRQQPPRQQQSSDSSDESDKRMMKLNEFMMSLKPIHEEQRSISKPATGILRPPSPEEVFYDASDQPPQQQQPQQQPPQQQQPQQQPQQKPKPQPKPRQSKYMNPPTPLVWTPAPPQPPPPATPVSNELTEANSWACPACTALNPFADTKLLKSNRVVCSVCAISCDDAEIIAKVKEQPVVKKEVPKQPAMSDQAPAKPPQPLSNDENWSCTACTMLNPNTEKSCTVCESPRDSGAGDAVKLPFKVKPIVARQRNPAMEEAANRKLLKLLQDIETSGADGRLAQLYLVATAEDGAQSVAGFQAWTGDKWPGLIEQVGCEVDKVLQDVRSGVIVKLRPSFDDIASAVLDSACDLETAIKLCAERHASKVAWIAKDFPELLQLSGELNFNLDGGLVAIFQAQNELAFKDFAEFLFSDESKEVPKFNMMNGSEASLYCLMGEFDLKKICDAEIFFKLMKSKEFDTCNLHDLAEAAKGSNGRFDYIDFVKSYLNCECCCCNGLFPKHKLLPMASCQCELCHECFHNFVSTTMLCGGHVTDLHCQFCGVPNANQVDELESHFSILLPQIQGFENPEFPFDEQVVNLVEKKITEWNLIRDRNFRCCSQCASGLVLDDNMLGLKFQCPDCLSYTCKDCNKPWKDQHKNIDCDQFEQWLKENDPDYQEKGVGFFLQANGIQCPSCHFQYALAKGGCLHFTCRQCRFQFCAGCDGEYQIIQGRGLTCKHPRDCLFYLRDFGVLRLQQLLQAHNVEFESEVEIPIDKCEVMEQKQRDGILVDEACGIEVKPNQANLCDKHYIEYLVSLVNKHKLDPIVVMEDGELRGACGRHGIDCSRVAENNVLALRDLIAQKEPLV